MAVIQTVLNIQVETHQMDEMIQALKSLMASARAGSGLISCKLYQQAGNLAEFMYLEDWQTADDLECQIRSSRYSQLLALMETASKPPSLKFHTVSRTQGLDYLQAVRGSAGSSFADTANVPASEND